MLLLLWKSQNCKKGLLTETNDGTNLKNGCNTTISQSLYILLGHSFEKSLLSEISLHLISNAKMWFYHSENLKKGLLTTKNDGTTENMLAIQ